MSNPRPLVAVMDGDGSVRESLPDLIREFGFTAQSFESAAELLSSHRLGEDRCQIVEAEMPGMSGLELLHKVRHRGYAIPVVFISDHRSEELRRQLMEEGATECLFKPLTSRVLLVLLDSIEVAVRHQGSHPVAA